MKIFFSNLFISAFFVSQSVCQAAVSVYAVSSYELLAGMEIDHRSWLEGTNVSGDHTLYPALESPSDDGFSKLSYNTSWDEESLTFAASASTSIRYSSSNEGGSVAYFSQHFSFYDVTESYYITFYPSEIFNSNEYTVIKITYEGSETPEFELNGLAPATFLLPQGETGSFMFSISSVKGLSPEPPFVVTNYGNYSINFTLSPVPEPTTFAFFTFGAVFCMHGLFRKKRI